MSIAHLLPEGLAADIEAACGARIAAIRPRGAGGASREGADIDHVWPDARTRQGTGRTLRTWQTCCPTQKPNWAR